MKLYCTFFICFILILTFPELGAQDSRAAVQNCASNAGNDAIYLKDFIVKLEGAQPNQKVPVFRTTMALRKGIIYRLNLCSDMNSGGQPVLHLYDDTALLLSTYNPETGKEYRTVSFECKKSGAYTIAISFKEGKAGEAIGILSYINK